MLFGHKDLCVSGDQMVRGFSNAIFRRTLRSAEPVMTNMNFYAVSMHDLHEFIYKVDPMPSYHYYYYYYYYNLSMQRFCSEAILMPPML